MTQEQRRTMAETLAIELEDCFIRMEKSSGSPQVSALFITSVKERLRQLGESTCDPAVIQARVDCAFVRAAFARDNFAHNMSAMRDLYGDVATAISGSPRGLYTDGKPMVFKP